MQNGWLPSDDEVRQMLDTRVYCPWYLWAYFDVISQRKFVLWTRSELPPLRESFALRLAACAAVPPTMIPP